MNIEEKEYNKFCALTGTEREFTDFKMETIINIEPIKVRKFKNSQIIDTTMDSKEY